MPSDMESHGHDAGWIRNVTAGGRGGAVGLEFFGAQEALYLISGYAVNFAIAAAISPAVDLCSSTKRPMTACANPRVGWSRSTSAAGVSPSRRCTPRRVAWRTGRRWRPLVMTDGVFPVSGQLAPLVDYLSLLKSHSGGMLLVDDAHGLATLGPKGRGCLELAGVSAGQVMAISTNWLMARGCSAGHALEGHRRGRAGSHRRFAGLSLSSARRAAGFAAPAPRLRQPPPPRPGLQPPRRSVAYHNDCDDNVAALATVSSRGSGLPVESSPSPIIGLTLENKTVPVKRHFFFFFFFFFFFLSRIVGWLVVGWCLWWVGVRVLVVDELLVVDDVCWLWC